MRDNSDIFIINEEGTLEINKDEIRGIKEYRELLAKDKGSEGDADGRKKYLAYKELMYVHLFASPLSIYRDLPETKRHENSKLDARLPDTWKKRKHVINACVRYERDMGLSSLMNSYLNANRAVYGVGEDIEFFNSERARLRNSITEDRDKLSSETLEGEIQDLENRLNNNTEALLAIGKKIISLSNSLPDAFKTLENLKERLSKESGGKVELYGGGKLNNREKL